MAGCAPRWNVSVKTLPKPTSSAAKKRELAELIKEFQSGGAQEIEGIKVIRTSEGVAFQVQGEVLFSSGQATITSGGKEALGRLLPTLREHGKNLRIDGHTDTDPIRRSQWKTNMRLSAERGMAVIDFLTSNGIAPATCFLAAYGEHRPRRGRQRRSCQTTEPPRRDLDAEIAPPALSGCRTAARSAPVRGVSASSPRKTAELCSNGRCGQTARRPDARIHARPGGV